MKRVKSSCFKEKELSERGRERKKENEKKEEDEKTKTTLNKGIHWK